MTSPYDWPACEKCGAVTGRQPGHRCTEVLGVNQHPDVLTGQVPVSDKAVPESAVPDSTEADQSSD